MRRRDILLGAMGGATLATFAVVNRAIAQDDRFDSLSPPDFKARRPVQFAADEYVPKLSEIIKQIESETGKESPRLLEIDLAIELLFDIPTTGTPYEIASRFHKWRLGEVGVSIEERERRQYYSREWPVRGNPVIMQFFDATGYRKPAGDTTFWCAAFVSWCIARSVGSVKANGNPWPYANGAASKSYRAWGQDVIADLKSDPRRGDLVVFQNLHSPNAGHVGFVDRITDNEVFVLGGNQGAQNEFNGGEVNISKFSRSVGGSLKLHSFRRHAVLS